MKYLLSVIGLASALTVSSHALAEDPHAVHDDHAGHGVNSENLFGVLAGSDLLPAGAFELTSDTAARLGKRGGSYSAVGENLGVSYGVNKILSVSLSGLASSYSVKNVEGLEDTSRTAFPAGLSGELRLRLLDRAHAPVGVTLSVAPGWQTIDQRSGQRATVLSVEDVLSIDTAIVPSKLFAAINLTHGYEHGKETGAAAWANGTTLGLGGAVTYAVLPNVFVGGQVRYSRAYEGSAADRFLGDAVFAGPSAYVQISHNTWASLSWSMQLTGREVGVSNGLNLSDFERHQVRAKIGFEF